MKKILIFTIACSFLLALHGRALAQGDNLNIHASLKGMEAGSWVYWHKITATEKDSVKTVAGGFTIRLNIPEGEGDIYILQIGNKYAEGTSLLLYLDKGIVDIKGDGPLFKDTKLSGSAYVQDLNAYHDLTEKDARLANEKEVYKKANELYKNHDSTGLAQLQPELDRLDSIHTLLSKQYVAQHPASPISAYVLYFYLRRSLSMADLETALNGLSAGAKNNSPAKEIAHSIAVNKQTGIGQMAPEFTQNDTAEKPVSLASFRGKYVLVDFWASWCHPCREENPNVVKAFTAYKDKNFTVLSVSLDRPGRKADWLKAIHDDHLDWTHVSDLKFWNNAVAKQYDIESIPSNFLIGPDGKIVAKDLHGDELEKKLSMLLGTAAAPSAPDSGSFVLNGTFSGQSDWVYLYYTGHEGKRAADSTKIINGHFVFKGSIDAPCTAWLSIGKKQRNSTTLFIAPSVMQLDLVESDIAHARLTGSPQQDEYRVLEDEKQLVEAKYKIPLDSMMAEKDHDKAAAIRERLAPYFAEMHQKDYDFFAAHPQSYVTASMMIYHTGDLTLDSLQLFYDRMGEKVQQSVPGKAIAIEIAKLRAGSPGSPAKDFTAKDMHDKLLTLSSFKGKAYVLIDFWASWCVPCRHSNPHLITLFKQYHTKGLEVIGVSDDDGKPDAWRKAVTADGVDLWHNVLRGLDWEKIRKGTPNEKDISEKFGIHTLPTKILIDKNGMIIGRYGEGPQDEASLDKKLEEIFL